LQCKSTIKYAIYFTVDVTEVLENLIKKVAGSFADGRFPVLLRFERPSRSSNKDFFPLASPVSSICAVEFEATLQVFSFLRRATLNRVSSFQECKIIALKIERKRNQRPHCDHCSLPQAFQCLGQVKKSRTFSKDSHDIFLEDCSQCEHLPKNSIQAHSGHVWAT